MKGVKVGGCLYELYVCVYKEKEDMHKQDMYLL